MQIAVIGAGPAGLAAAEAALEGGADVDIFEAKPSCGRKLLVAGRGGLNLTHDEPIAVFAGRYRNGGRADPGVWLSLLSEFGPLDSRRWAENLGVPTIVASTGRVYPKEMRAAPLLRRWIARLRGLGVRIHVRRQWTGLTKRDAELLASFDHSGTAESCAANAIVLALGGASWPETGSDGLWNRVLTAQGVKVSPFEPANCGWEAPWTAEFIAQAEGKPLKNIVASAGGEESEGELMITRYGLEGGAIYTLGPALRRMERPSVTIDLKPALAASRLVAKLGPVRKNLLAEAKVRWRLGEAAAAVLQFCSSPADLLSPETLAHRAKSCAIPLLGPRPIAEAISSAGGVSWSEVEPDLMVKKCPGLFLAGEMLDWEAPTGGYLLQGCLATGRRAGRCAAAWARVNSDAQSRNTCARETFPFFPTDKC